MRVEGLEPSGYPVKACKVFSLYVEPLGVSSKIVPLPYDEPPLEVTPYMFPFESSVIAAGAKPEAVSI